jgi:hypothetical protein
VGVYIRDIKDLVNDIPKVTLAGSRLGMEHLHFTVMSLLLFGFYSWAYAYFTIHLVK